MKLLKCLLCLSAFVISYQGLACAAPAAASKGGEGPIYVVNMQKVLSESVAGKAARSNVEAELKKSEARLGQLRMDIQKSREEIDKQSGLLAESALSQKQEALDKKEKDYDRAVDDEKASVEKRNRQEIEQIVGKIEKIVKEISDQQNFQVVIEKDPRLVLYVDEDYDLSDQVIKLLNKEVVDL